jgi:hypothetical protein
MHINIWSHDANPAIDRRLLRRSRAYCETEVREGRAKQLDPDDIRLGIHLFAPDDVIKKAKTERRGSPESAGCLTANESSLNADFRGNLADREVEAQLRILAAQYESRLEQHEAEGKKGQPRACSVIAAKVKTILSDPAEGRKALIRRIYQRHDDSQTHPRSDGRESRIPGAVAGALSAVPAGA